MGVLMMDDVLLSGHSVQGLRLLEVCGSLIPVRSIGQRVSGAFERIGSEAKRTGAAIACAQPHGAGAKQWQSANTQRKSPRDCAWTRVHDVFSSTRPPSA